MVDGHSQRRVRAHREDLALSIVAAQLSDHTPLALHKLALLRVAQPDNLPAGSDWSKSDLYAPADGSEIRTRPAPPR